MPSTRIYCNKCEMDTEHEMFLDLRKSLFPKYKCTCCGLESSNG